MKEMNEFVRLVANLGKWLSKISKNKTNAILLILLSLFSPFGFIIAASMIVHFYTEGKKRRTKRY